MTTSNHLHCGTESEVEAPAGGTGGAAFPGPVGARITLRAPNRTSAFTCRPGEPMLYAGLRNGLNLPYECATGTCGTCRLSGSPADVRPLWAKAPGQGKLRAGGEILLCQSVARHVCEITSASPMPAWPEGLSLPDHYRGRVAFRQVLTRDVAAVTVALDRPMRFEPGQFAVLRSRTIPGYRAYSMVEGDGAATNLIFIVKRKPGGMASPWLVDGRGDDSPIEVFGPLGRAVLRPQEEAHLLVAAGGTGIAGSLAVLRQAAARGHFERFRADIFFGVRALTDAFLLGSLSELARHWPERVRVVIAVSDEPLTQGRHPTYPAIELASGPVDVVLARAIAGPRSETVAFVGGPPPMVDASIRVLLKTARLPPADIRFDRFW